MRQNGKDLDKTRSLFFKCSTRIITYEQNFLQPQRDIPSYIPRVSLGWSSDYGSDGFFFLCVDRTTPLKRTWVLKEMKKNSLGQHNNSAY